MERDIFDQWFAEDIEQWIADTVGDSNTAYEASPDSGVTGSATLFENIGAVIRAADDELEEHGYVISSSAAYSLLATLLDMALVYEWLDDKEQWETIIDLFTSRAGELVGEEDGIAIEDMDIPPEKATAIANQIVRDWVENTAYYRKNEFTVGEKVYMIRSILISLRNSRHLSYDPWLKTLLSSLSTDWELLGGTLFNSNTGGPGGWSYGGQ